MTRDQIEIAPAGPLNASIRPPGSKSITNRALVCAALARGRSTLKGALDSDDTRVMVDGLRRLGIRAQTNYAKCEIEVEGCHGRLPNRQAELFVGNSGTTVRFLTALATLGSGRYALDGVPRMRERPIQDLLDALGQLGADAKSELGTGCPPVTVQGRGLRGGAVTIRGDTSSQFLSALLMAAPYAKDHVTITVEGGLVSHPYVTMTLRVMAAFGGKAEESPSGFEVSAGTGYLGQQYAIEPDASAASYFWAAAAIAGGQVEVLGLSRDAIQGDVHFCDCLRQMGCHVRYDTDRITVQGASRLRGIDVDMNSISDTVQTLAVVALLADGPTTIRGVAHIRHKETDRIGDLARELRKLGASIEELEDGLRITPGKLRPAQMETYDDHRMAMSLSLAGLVTPGVVIKHPRCVEKTYPQFFRDLATITQDSS